MRQDTLKITTGAMFIAIFTLFMIINRQTGGMFEGIMLYLLPIPMVAYAAKFGFKTGLPVVFAMGIMAFFFGNVTSLIYAMTAAFTGLVFGTCIYKKVDSTKTLFIVMGMSTLSDIVTTLIFALFMSYDITAEVEEYRAMMMEAVETSANLAGGSQAELLISTYDQLLTPSMMMRMFLLSMILAGALQGFIVYEVSLLILNKLRFQIAKPRSVFSYTPPRVVSYIAIALYVFYLFYAASPNETLQSISQMAGICGYMYLVFFGFLQVLWYFKQRYPGHKVIAVVIAFALMMMFSMLLSVFGIYYVFNHNQGENLPAEVDPNP